MKLHRYKVGGGYKNQFKIKKNAEYLFVFLKIVYFPFMVESI